MAERIYVADDDQSLLDSLSSFLKKDGFDVETFQNGDDVMSACDEELPDLALLDVVMPGTDGLSTCSSLRRSYPQLPIILMSAKDSPYDKVTGLMIGADDYLGKPFLPIELAARIRALFRRANIVTEKQHIAQTFSFGSLTLYPERRTATLFGENFPLTPNEFGFLLFMMERNGEAVSREELITRLWKVEWQGDMHVADDLVKRLRRKLRERGSDVEIKTVWGYGFRLVIV